MCKTQAPNLNIKVILFMPEADENHKVNGSHFSFTFASTEVTGKKNHPERKNRQHNIWELYAEYTFSKYTRTYP